MLRADNDEDENLEKKIVSSRCGVCDATYADVKTKVGKYGNDGSFGVVVKEFSFLFLVLCSSLFVSSGVETM